MPEHFLGFGRHPGNFPVDPGRPRRHHAEWNDPDLFRLGSPHHAEMVALITAFSSCQYRMDRGTIFDRRSICRESSSSLLPGDGFYVVTYLAQAISLKRDDDDGLDLSVAHSYHQGIRPAILRSMASGSFNGDIVLLPIVIGLC